MAPQSVQMNPPSVPPVLGELYLHLAPHMAELDKFIQDQVSQFEPEIREMAAYCLETTGKRLRPTLVFITGWKEGATVDQDLIRAAGVIEMVHLATLVHDDIMDRAEIRRSRPTAARQFGSDAAVLLGDALFSQALHIAAHFPTTEVCRLVAESTRKACTGEIMQTLRRRDLIISLAEYRRIIDLKTAELFRLSCYLGASLSGQPAEFAKAADRFGHHLGLAYQIYDDLVDFLGEEQQIGKTLGTDLATGKLTLPIMVLLDKLSPAERESVIGSFRGGEAAGLSATRRRMKELGVKAEVIQAVKDELAHAIAALEPHQDLAAVPLMRHLAGSLESKIEAVAANQESR